VICNFREEDITQKQIDEVEKRGAREGRLRVLNQLTEDQRKELRKKEVLTYARRNKASVPLLQLSTPLHLEVEVPLPSTKKVVPPPSPPIRELLPKPTSTKEEIQLNIDMSAMFGKLNIIVLVIEMCKIPSVRKEVLKLLKVPTEKEDPPIILNTVYLDRQKDNNPPFYLSLGINGLHLNNCMLDSGASANVMSLKVME